MNKMAMLKQELERLLEFVDETEAEAMRSGPPLDADSDNTDGPPMMGGAMEKPAEAGEQSGMCPTCGKPYGPGHMEH
jgi:hypothetical protein